MTVAALWDRSSLGQPCAPESFARHLTLHGPVSRVDSDLAKCEFSPCFGPPKAQEISKGFPRKLDAHEGADIRLFCSLHHMVGVGLPFNPRTCKDLRN